VCALLFSNGRHGKDVAVQHEGKEIHMSSEAIVVLVIVALAIAGLVYLEMHSRRNKRNEKNSEE
jgi:hypothetical protein